MNGDTAPPTSPTSRPGEPASPARARIPAWVTVLPLVCLLATTAFWWQTRSALRAMDARQQQVMDLLDEMRGVATLDVSGNPALGSDDAIVTLVEFSDYECPFCIRHFTQTMGAIDEKYIRTGRIQYVFRDLPIDQLHPEAIRAHEAAHCAAEQGKFWEMHVKLFSPAGSHTREQLEAKATEAGVSLQPFRECLDSGRTTAAVRASVADAARLGANGTPSFFVGLRDPKTNQVRLVDALSGAQPFAEFEKVIAAVEARQR